MGYNFINNDTLISVSTICRYDSNISYFADFSENGNVNGWDYCDSIYCYGVWSGFLFGTLYGSYGVIGRTNVFRQINATTHYTLKIVMKYNPIVREGAHVLPSRSKIRWRSAQSTLWNEDKEKYFTLYPDNKWHTYILNMGVERYWQGDINDLRLWVASEDGQDGDEFFIRSIEIFSIQYHECTNLLCNKYSSYSHPCPWVGSRAYCESIAHHVNSVFSIQDKSEFVININNYGNEVIKTDELINASGYEVANMLSRAISAVNIGGYAEAQVIYTDENKFRIYIGTITSDGDIEIIDNDLSRMLLFFDYRLGCLYNKINGSTPANGYSSLSDYKINTFQLLSLFDESNTTGFYFEPFIPSIESGRRDWLSSSIGLVTTAIGSDNNDYSGQPIRTYHTIDNAGKTIIDFNHPFNASGRINKIYAECTLDENNYRKTISESIRKSLELSNAKIIIFRPKRNGTLDVVTEISINDRDPNRNSLSELYSLTQEVVDLDVDIFINKGDLLGIYNANLYVGKSISGNEVDAQYFQIDGKPNGNFNPGRLYGNGNAGVLLYAKSNEVQRKLIIDIDFKKRYNIDNIIINGAADSSILEFNIARCLDVNWDVELFGEYHWTYHKSAFVPGEFKYQRFNVAYGLNNLNDGILNVPDGLACDSFSITNDYTAPGITWNAGPGVIPTNPRYFWINGDEEWLAVWLHAQWYHFDQAVFDFTYDPIAIFLHFPYQKEKTIYKSIIYFKEKYNFRSFATSTYLGSYNNTGNADDVHYQLIPSYTAITIDNRRYLAEEAADYNLDKYLFQNPCFGHIIEKVVGETIYEWDPVLSDAIRLFYNDPYGGYFVSQSTIVSNYQEWEQARRIDWQTIKHEWEPIKCKGWRIYTNAHNSTKICEMELYGVVADSDSNFSGGININHSDYGDIWWPLESVQLSSDSVEVFVGDTPRYLYIEFSPIVSTRYNTIEINVKNEDVYVGEKGCEYFYYSKHSKLGGNNDSQIIELKNVYQNPYDLYVDIASNQLIDKGLIFYSTLSGGDSISNPNIGPDAMYYKLPDYRILNNDYNCAINCGIFGLRNLLHNKEAYYSYDKMITWQKHEVLQADQAINFHNLPTISKTYIVLPELSRNRFWKFGFKCGEISANVREARFFDENFNEYTDIQVYHDLNRTFEDGNICYRAPHLLNDNVVGSYYTLTNNQYITVDLGGAKILKAIELTHDGLLDYNLITRSSTLDNANGVKAGIDKYSKLCLRPWVDSSGGHLVDMSYYEHQVLLHGVSEVINGQQTYTKIEYSVDFGCLTDWANWESKTDYCSSHGITISDTVFSGTCASGTTISGIYEYPGNVYFILNCARNSYDSFYYDLRVDPINNPAWYASNQAIPFEIKFKIRFDSSDPDFSEDGAICVGLMDMHTAYNPYYSIGEAFVPGAQIFFEPRNGKVGLSCKSNSYNQLISELDFPYESYIYIGTPSESVSKTGITLGATYYCKFWSEGSEMHVSRHNVVYSAKLWADNWDGVNEVMDLSLTSKLPWEAYRVGVSSSYGVGNSYPDPCVVKGMISDFNFNIDYNSKNYPFKESETIINERASIRIPLGEENYVSIKKSDELKFLNRRYTIDFWAKFNSFPDLGYGDYFTLIEDWNYSDGLNSTKAWSIRLVNIGNWYRFEVWLSNNTQSSMILSTCYVSGSPYSNIQYIPPISFIKDKWYHFFISNGTHNNYGYASLYSNSVLAFFSIDGMVFYNHGNMEHNFDSLLSDTINDIIIGRKFDGWITEPRISIGGDINNGAISLGGGCRSESAVGTYLPISIKPYEKLYIFSFYISDDNIFFCHYADMDTMFQDSYNYYFPQNYFAKNYNSIFAIDLQHRRKLDYIRHYGVNDLYSIDELTNIIYSNIDTDDPDIAFNTEYELDPNDTFEGWGNIEINAEKWIIIPFLNEDITRIAYSIGNENQSYVGSAFDNDIITIGADGAWHSYYNGAYKLDGWVGQNFGIDKERIIYKYKICSGNDSNRTYDPKNWTFEGSTNQINWVILHSVENVYFSAAQEWKYYYIDNHTPYRYYRLNISENNGNETYLIVQEIEMYEEPKIVYPQEHIRLANGYLESCANFNIPNSKFRSRYSIGGDFDVEVKCGRTNISPNTNSWRTIFKLVFSNSSGGENYIDMGIEYDYNNPSPYYFLKIFICNNGSITTFSKSLGSLYDTGFRIKRQNDLFRLYYYDGGTWYSISNCRVTSVIGKDVLYILMGTVVDNNNPTVINYYRDFKFNYYEKLIQRSTKEDARWVGVELLNGDTIDKYIYKLGIYPDITENISLSGNNYNCEWDDLGSGVTTYSEGTNLAVGATTSGSSYVYGHGFELVVDGLIGEEFKYVWATDNSSEQWLLLDFGEEKSIYRIKLFFGYDDEDTKFLIKDYQIQTSLNGQTFTTIFNISSNTSFRRVHDLQTPISVRYVRLYVTKYDTDIRWLFSPAGSLVFKGMILREIEIYEYYGFTSISSEQYPIIALNLKDQFYINHHSLIGMFTEDNDLDWSNENSNFTYSDSVFSDPCKVVFNSFGSPFGFSDDYEQWVAIKRNTATYYNADPAATVNNAYGIDYLKHVIITSHIQQNPIDYWWWWQSDLSTLSNDFNHSTMLALRSLRIDYPASNVLDTIKFRGGTNFGIDSDISRRDGLAFRFYIDNVNNLDTTTGYFFFGGLDGTQNKNYVEYRWYWSTFSGTVALQSGWNSPFFRFQTADEKIYISPANTSDDIHPLMREYTQWNSIGLKIKGIGNPMVLLIDGFVIQRNHFNDYSKFCQGLYLAGSDYLTTPLGELDLGSGTIEFWLRPDYTFSAYDEFNRIKNRSFFSINNVINEVFGMVITSKGIFFYFGNSTIDLAVFRIDGLSINSIDKLYHFGIVFSNNGKYISSDNSTIKLYINNYLVGSCYETWDIIDNKSFKFIFGGKCPLAILESASTLNITSIDAVVSELKIYNYCKTDFSDSLNLNIEQFMTNDLLTPDEMIEISKDNVTFYRVGDTNLPFLFEQVPAETIIPVYIKSIVPNNLIGSESRTSKLSISWDVGV